MSQDFSVFGWMLPEQEMDVLIIPVIISLIGYIILFIIIRKLMKRFLNSKPWHKYLRRGIWIGIFTLMFFDPVYYFFWIEHGMCKADRARVYPAPPASYVVAGPMSKEELETYLTQLPKEERNALRSWSCQLNGQESKNICLIKNIKLKLQHDSLPFGFVHNSDAFQNSIDNEKYQEFIQYETNGHWLTKFLFGYKIKWRQSYASLFSCANTFYTKEVPINLN